MYYVCLVSVRSSIDVMVMMWWCCQNSKKKQSEFLCEVEYRNVVPDPPTGEPKLRLLQLPLQR
jgi:hypothetical protein